MGRAPRFTSDQLLDAALEIALAKGPAAVSMAAVAAAVGAPSGSMYHRFANRNELMAQLWLRTITDFQAGLLEALDRPDTALAAAACLDHVFGWTDTHPELARLMLLYSASDITADWPDTLAVTLQAANHGVRDALVEFTQRHFGNTERESVDRTVYALIDLPYAAIRRHLPNGRPRPWLRTFTYNAAHRALALTKAT